MIPGLALSELTPENIEKIKGLIEDARNEIDKLKNKLLHSAGLTESENYEGLEALTLILGSIALEAWGAYKTLKKDLAPEYKDLLAIYTDIRVVIRSASVFFGSMAMWAGTASKDVSNAVSAVEHLPQNVSKDAKNLGNSLINWFETL